MASSSVLVGWQRTTRIWRKRRSKLRISSDGMDNLYSLSLFISVADVIYYLLVSMSSVGLSGLSNISSDTLQGRYEKALKQINKLI